MLFPIKYAMTKHIPMAPYAYGMCNNTLMHTPSSDACAKVSPKKAKPFQRPMHPKGAVIRLAIRAVTVINRKNESIIYADDRDDVDT